MDVKDESHEAGLAVEVDSLVKRYGELVAVDGLSLTIPRGQVLGLLGPNGSGKTTTISCILQLLTYDKGSIRVFGEPMTPTSYGLKRRIRMSPSSMSSRWRRTSTPSAPSTCAIAPRGAAWWPRRSPSSAWRSS